MKQLRQKVWEPAAPPAFDSHMKIAKVLPTAYKFILK